MKSGFNPDWFLQNLVCPVDKSPLTFADGIFHSRNGRSYPVVEGIPVMVVESVEQTHGAAAASLIAGKEVVATGTLAPETLINTVGVADSERVWALQQITDPTPKTIDPIISILIGATNGYAYLDVLGALPRVPVPKIPAEIKSALGNTVLDIGCNWGRWSVAAAKGEPERLAVGIDPSLAAVMAARRLAEQEGARFVGVVGDARYLPLRNELFDNVISYSVLQHFSRADVRTTVGEIARVLVAGGSSAVQMPNRLGVRCLFNQARRGFAEGRDFDVRYWSLAELKGRFGHIGPVSLLTDCYFGLGLQASDLDLMPPLARNATRVSEFLKSVLGRRGAGCWLADSVWVISHKQGQVQSGKPARNSAAL